MIGLQEYLMGRDDKYPISEDLTANAAKTICLANKLMLEAQIMRGVRSGYRPAEINKLIPNAAPMSRHITCQAVDLIDNDGKLKDWCLKNLDFLVEIGLWMESPEFTPTWLHVQTIAPGSGHRVFLP